MGGHFPRRGSARFPSLKIHEDGFVLHTGGPNRDNLAGRANGIPGREDEGEICV
jgi:hypothetical protein